MSSGFSLDVLDGAFHAFNKRAATRALRMASPSRVPVNFLQQRTSWAPIMNSPYQIYFWQQIIIWVLVALFILAGAFFWKEFRRQRTITGTEKSPELLRLEFLQSRHETASVLADLVEKDGAGAWPPKADHESWPLALRPYNDIYLELLPLLSYAEPSTDDRINNERCQKYRSLMRTFLTQRINIAEVEEIMSAVESGSQDVISRAAYNGFYCCIAVCRHAYRWATIPVVKVAQIETVVDFPPEIDIPWSYLQRNFGVTAESGNNTANVLHNYNKNGNRTYKINVGMSDQITLTEEAFFRMFFDVEILAFPIYIDMVCAITSFQHNDQELCVRYLESITCRLRQLLTVFYENLKEARVSHSVWLSYVQGFQGWGVGKIVDGQLIKYDGLSGNQVLFFQALDAFLGIDRYLADEEMNRYIPRNQRRFSSALRTHSFRSKLSKDSDPRIDAEIQKIVNHLRVFRAAHRTRVMPYLKEPAPERLTMTAGNSVLEGSTAKDAQEALKGLDQMLFNRLKQTV